MSWFPRFPRSLLIIFDDDHPILRNGLPDSALPATTCDLCGEVERDFVLRTPRLDGPLVRCRGCRLFYVLMPPRPEARAGAAGEEAATTEMERLSARARELALVEPTVEEGERPWRELAARERIADLRRFIDGGRLIEVGSSTGELLAAAGGQFAATGIEADAGSSRVSQSRGLDCRCGTLAAEGFESGSFDVAVLYHTIEHLESPRRTLQEARRLLRPGGWLALETPNIATLWYELLGARWRQFIPDHRFFYTPETIRRLTGETGFEVVELRAVGKAMSLRLFSSRVGRYSPLLGRSLAGVSRRLGVEERTLRLNLGDVMRLYARRRE